MTRAEGRSRRTSPLAIVLVIGLVVVLLVGGWWFFTEGPGWRIVSPPGSTVAEFSGSSHATTDAFRVREGWQIEWETSGPSFVFAIRGDRDFGTVINQEEAASGITSPTGSGTFYLDVTAQGPWSIRILQGE